MDVKEVGKISFLSARVSVWGSLDEPLFKLGDVAKAIDYSENNTYRLKTLLEEDEYLELPVVVAGQRRKVIFVTETGLYNLLAQSRKPIARIWRRIIFEQLIDLRRSRGNDIVEQFDEWELMADDIYYDDETGEIMMSVMTPGGDVEQVSYKGGE